MEVVVLLVAMVGIALLVVPRVQRRSAGARRAPSVTKRSRAPRRARSAAVAPIVAAPAVASWTPPAAAEAGGPDADVWEDDLGWEGGEAGAPSPAAREAWEQWRTTDSPLAPAAEADVVPEVPELPSVERWRRAAEAGADDEWVEDDDDGLGWEGEETPPAPRALWNGDSPSPSPAPAGGEWSPDTVTPVPDGWGSSRDWSRAAPAQAADEAPAFASASTAGVAPDSSSAPEAGRTVALEEDEEWHAPVGRSWGAPASGASSAPASDEAAPRRASRTSRVHPVLLVAVYAAVGIGAVVLASTVLLGGSEPDRTAATVPASASATPSAAPVAATPVPPDPVAQAAAGNDFTRERTDAARRHNAAAAAAIADARRAAKRARAREKARQAAADRRRAARRRAAVSTPNPTPTTTSGGSGSGTTPPAQTYTPPAPTNQAPATKRRSGCEFCIG